MAEKAVIKVSVNEQVYQYLKEQIVTNRLPPHTKINVPEVAQQLGVSRMPVNTALARLRNEGYVVILPQSGSYVRELSREELGIIFRCRAGMEREILLAYGGQLDRERLEEFRRRFSAVYSQKGCTAEVLEENFSLDVAFHAFVVGSCPEIISHEVLNIMDLTRRSRLLEIQRIIREGCADRYRREMEVHLDIIQAILDGDLPRAGDLLYRDIMDTYHAGESGQLRAAPDPI